MTDLVCLECDFQTDCGYIGDNKIYNYSTHANKEFFLCQYCLHAILVTHFEGKQCLKCHVEHTKRRSGLCNTCSKVNQELDAEMENMMRNIIKKGGKK